MPSHHHQQQYPCTPVPLAATVFPVEQWGEDWKIAENGGEWEMSRQREKREMKNFLQSLLIHTSRRQLQTFHWQILFLSPAHTHTLSIIQRPGEKNG